MAATKTRRQPVDLQLRHGHLTHRDAIWAAIREIRTGIEIGVLETRTRASQDTIRTYLTGLTKAGYLVRTDNRAQAAEHGRFERAQWDLVKDNGVEAPRVNRHGKPVTQGLARENMWRTMRAIKTFSVQDLVIHASTRTTQVKPGDAKDYIKYLKAAGYLRIIERRRPGHSTRYQFVEGMYKGPLPPMVQAVKQVYDPNIRRVMWTQGGDA